MIPIATQILARKLARDLEAKGKQVSIAEFMNLLRELLESANISVQNLAKFGGVFHIKCFRADGTLKWTEEAKNLVVNVGLQHILDVVFSGSTQVTTWYIGLTASSPTPASADTMSSHSGWSEFTAYDEATRQEYVEVRSSQQLSNTASKATFTISTDSSSIGGAFITSSNTKSGTSGTLMCIAAFSTGNKSADDNDILQVTYTFTAADDGV